MINYCIIYLIFNECFFCFDYLLLYDSSQAPPLILLLIRFLWVEYHDVISEGNDDA